MIEILSHDPEAITVRIKRPIERMTLASLAQHLADQDDKIGILRAGPGNYPVACDEN